MNDYFFFVMIIFFFSRVTLAPELEPDICCKVFNDFSGILGTHGNNGCISFVSKIKSANIQKKITF